MIIKLRKRFWLSWSWTHFDRLRRFWSRQSLTIKLFLTLSLLVVLIVSAGSFAVMSLSRYAIADTSVTTALYQIQLLKTKLLETMMSDEPRHEGLAALLQKRENRAEVSEINIFDKVGQVTFSSSSNNLGKNVVMPEKSKVRMTSDGAMVEMNGRHQKERLRIIHPIEGSSKCMVCHQNANHEPLGGIELYVPLEPIYRRFGHSRTIFILTALGIVLFGAFLIRWLVHAIVKQPIRKLISVMEKAEKGEWDVRTRIAEDPELRQLAKRFNAMVRGIDAARREIEAQHQRELSQSNRLASLGQLLSNVSHEIKNPLAAMSSALHALRRSYPSHESEEQIFDELMHQIDRIEKTVSHLLRYARQAPPRFEILNVLVPLEHAIALAEHYLSKHKIQIHRGWPSHAIQVRGDAGALQQVFLNLILNASQAMSDGGHLFLRIHEDPCDSKSKSRDEKKESLPAVTITVEDTGVGISPENMGKIFQPFFTTKKEGTGLGLSVTRGIVEDHGGTIFIESIFEKGTQVHVRLPVMNAHETSRVGSQKKNPKGVAYEG